MNTSTIPLHNKKKSVPTKKNRFHPPTDGTAEDFTTSGDKMAERSEQPETAAREPKNTIKLARENDQTSVQPTLETQPK